MDAEINVIVKGDLEDMVSLRYATQPDSAVPGEHYLTKSEQLIFKPGEKLKRVQIGLLEARVTEKKINIALNLAIKFLGRE